jgi:hypothetical protein
MTTNFTATATKTLLVSLAALAIGLAGPAAAKDRSHHASGAYARVPVNSGAPAPEPIYMAIQTKGWKENN